MSPRRCSAFTLIELLVVLVIISLVSAAVLPTVLPALSHRQISESARLVQATIEGCRDAAIRSNAPRGVRLIPDPAFPGSTTDVTAPLAYNRMVPIEPAPDYSDGLVSAGAGTHPDTVPYPGAGTTPYPPQALRLEAAHYDGQGLPVGPPNWFWNIRVGDRIRIGGAGHLYTIVGPLVSTGASNPELFVNVGPPGTPSPITRTFATVSGNKDERVEFLYLVNGQDDDGDGYVDEGWDGVDNDGDTLTDEIAGSLAEQEWEQEVWVGSQASGGAFQLPYTIKRRPVPTQGGRIVELPSAVVIDATTGATTRERSRLQVDPNALTVDILIAPNGQVIPTTVYSSPASASVVPFVHLFLTERGDVATPSVITGVSYSLPMPAGSPRYPAAGDTSGRVLKGERRIVSVNTRSGNIVTTDAESFDGADVNAPFYAAQNGMQDAR